MNIRRLLKKFYPVFIVLVVTLLLFIWLTNKKKSPQRTNGISTMVSVPVMEVKIENIQIEIPIIGKLEAKNHIQIYSEVQGVLEKGNKEFLEGVSYRKGELLLSINSKNAEYNLMSQRSSLLTQIAQILPNIQYDFLENAPAWEKYLSDFSVEDEIQPLPYVKNERERYYISGKGIYQTYYNIKNLEYTLGKYQIKAPFNGTVVSSEIKTGTLIRAGQLLGEYMSTYTYDMETSVTVKQSSLIKVGDKAVLRSESINGEITGTVTRINDNVNPQTLMVNVYITVNDNDLREGMYLSGNIYSSSNIVGIKIPRRLITNDNTVYTIKDDTIVEKSVDILSLSGDRAIIVGLNDGEIISTKFQNIYNGQKVNTL